MMTYLKWSLYVRNYKLGLYSRDLDPPGGEEVFAFYFHDASRAFDHPLLALLPGLPPVPGILGECLYAPVNFQTSLRI